LDAYRAGFFLILAWSLLSCIMIALTTETNCQQKSS